MPRTPESESVNSSAKSDASPALRLAAPTPIAKRRRTAVRESRASRRQPVSKGVEHASRGRPRTSAARGVSELRTEQDRVARATSATHTSIEYENQPTTWSLGHAFEQPCARRGPRDCVWGTPVALGTAVMGVTGGKSAMETAVMSSVQSDNFKFVRHMIMSGWTYLQANDSTFSVSINRLGADRQVQEDWHVSNASPLHFAISCGSLNAAAALLVAFPELSTTVCRVEIESELESKSTFALWTPLELASFFADLYCAVDTPRYLAYHQAAQVLHALLRQPSRFPFLHLATPTERLLAAGADMSDVLAALSAL